MKSSFLKESGTLIGGNAVAQGIVFAAYLLLGRLYSPQDFELYTIFFSYIEVLIILSTCKLELAIVVAQSHAESRQVSALARKLNVLVSLVLLALGLVLILTPLGSSLNLPILRNGWCVILIAPMVYLCGTTRIYIFTANRHRRYAEQAGSEIMTSLSGTISKVLLGLFSSLHAVGMPIGVVLGKLFGNLYLRNKCRKLEDIKDDKETPHFTYRQILSRHRNFPLFVVPKDILSALSANLPFLWLASYSADASLGLFGMALAFTMRPVNMINGAFEKVFFARCSESVRQSEPIGILIRRFVWITLSITIPLAAIGYFVAEPLFVWLLGSQWVGTGYYIRCLLPWIVAVLTANSLMFVSNIFGTQRIEFRFQIVLFLLRIAALGIGIYQQNIKLAVLLFALASAAVSTALLIWYLWQVRRYDSQTASLHA